MIKALPSSIWSSLNTEMIFCFYCVFFQILPQQSGHAPKINKWKSPHAAQHQHHTPAAKMFSLSLCPESKCDVSIAQSWFFCAGAAEVVVLCCVGRRSWWHQWALAGPAQPWERNVLPWKRNWKYAWGSCFACNQASCLRKCQTLLHQGQM